MIDNDKSERKAFVGVAEATKYMDKLYRLSSPIDDPEKFDRENPEMAQKFASVICQFTDDMEKLCLELQATKAKPS